MSVESQYLAQHRLRFWWLWWALGWAMLAGTVNDSLERHPPHFTEFFYSDKLMHFTGYFLLGTWFAGLVDRRRYLMTAALLIAFSGVIEIAQGLMHWGRQAEWLDFLANTLGVSTSFAIAYAGLGMWMIWIERLLRLQK